MIIVAEFILARKYPRPIFDTQRDGYGFRACAGQA
jgi:hypothetical protein